MSVFFNDTATTEIYTLSLHDALPISDATTRKSDSARISADGRLIAGEVVNWPVPPKFLSSGNVLSVLLSSEDRKSTRLNSSHANISYAVFCLKKKNKLTSH